MMMLVVLLSRCLVVLGVSIRWLPLTPARQTLLGNSQSKCMILARPHPDFVFQK